MKIRFEVATRKSWGWKYFVKRAKKIGACTIDADVFAVEVATPEAALEIWQCIRGWKYVTVFVENKIMGSSAFSQALWKIQMQPLRTNEMLRQIIKKANQRRDDDGRSDRWRMGLGPDPELGF